MDELIKQRDTLINVINYLENAYEVTKLDDIRDLYLEALSTLMRIKDEIDRKDGSL